VKKLIFLLILASTLLSCKKPLPTCQSVLDLRFEKCELREDGYSKSDNGNNPHQVFFFDCYGVQSAVFLINTIDPVVVETTAQNATDLHTECLAPSKEVMKMFMNKGI
jgi:hypothetical protein